METCKDCNLYVADEGLKKGTCVIMGTAELIENNSTITDRSEEDIYPYHTEVGENFGCIHFESK